MDILLLVGRILLSLLFLGSGVNHLAQPDGVVGYSAFREAPVPRPMVQLTGLWLLAAGLSVALGVWGDLGSLMLLLFLLATAFRVHRFWRDADPAIRATETAMFMKNIALSGAVLITFALFRASEAGWTLTGPLLR
ncbi:DoxX family membrane protein [Catellatospora vulcania]|uniref:DoxX family membrane protein n=1 Tax=Catellatospora vulcania TaxID=1460450 RepID=UPI0012D45F18|nr:DoxX family membrane protein [Catellatospora vulcania]